tara:strand:+ start:399 stop:773 length:375 start_codon:yes stop_codon:yes gene_type:complete
LDNNGYISIVLVLLASFEAFINSKCFFHFDGRTKKIGSPKAAQIPFIAIKGICAALGLPIFFVRPSKWKKHFELINASKDASRTKTIEMYPLLSNDLAKKKDVNKSDAILIARFYSETRLKEEN